MVFVLFVAVVELAALLLVGALNQLLGERWFWYRRIEFQMLLLLWLGVLCAGAWFVGGGA